MPYVFEWDRRKAATNKRKHRVGFEEASSVFGDPLAITIRDPDHSVGEERFIILGMSTKSRLLVVAFAERPSRTHHLGPHGYQERTEII